MNRAGAAEKWHFECNGRLSIKNNTAAADTSARTFQLKELTMTKIAATQTKLTDETPVELQEMAAAIEALPQRYRDAVAPALARVVECSTRRRRILNLVQEALSQLRLDMKYLIFDLEATRRERDQYKEMLEKDQS
ncbi:transcription regulator [Rhodopirellula sp. SWK7]|nr:transcription regulator [Rhodopirellula sp. SWK7]